VIQDLTTSGTLCWSNGHAVVIWPFSNVIWTIGRAFEELWKDCPIFQTLAEYFKTYSRTNLQLDNVHVLLWHIGNECCVEYVQMKELSLTTIRSVDQTPSFMECWSERDALVHNPWPTRTTSTNSLLCWRASQKTKKMADREMWQVTMQEDRNKKSRCDLTRYVLLALTDQAIVSYRHVRTTLCVQTRSQ
jgi:hypothetical protein